MCDDGEYIANKICVDCPGHCKDGAPCNKLTGMCDSGCANQWTGTFCNCMFLLKLRQHFILNIVKVLFLKHDFFDQK